MAHDEPKAAPNAELRTALAREVQQTNLNAVARSLDVPRTAVTSVIVGSAREGTKLLVAERVRERERKRSIP